MKVFIHLGLIKTGSTFLQSSVFPIIEKNSSTLYIGPTKNINQYHRLSKERKNLLISNENISGNPLHLFESKDMLEQFRIAINNLRFIYRDPKLIIGFREPSEFIQSVYKQYLHERGTESWESFCKNRKESFWKQFYFSDFIRELKKSFNEESLFLYNYSDLKTNKQALLKSLFDFLGEDEKLLEQIMNNNNPQRESNKSIPLELEPVIIFLNKLSQILHESIGFHLGFRLGKFIINPQIICQKYLAPFITSKKKRDLSGLKRLYSEDWCKCLIFFVKIS